MEWLSNLIQKVVPNTSKLLYCIVEVQRMVRPFLVQQNEAIWDHEWRRPRGVYVCYVYVYLYALPLRCFTTERFGA